MRSVEDSPEPLGRRAPPFRTGDAEEARRHLTGSFRSHDLQFLDGDRRLAVTHRALACGRVALHDLGYGGHVRMSAPGMDRFYLFQVALHGPFRIWRNHRATEVPARMAYAVNPDEAFAKDWLPDGRQLIVRIDRAALQAHARALLGEEAEIAFRPNVVADAADLMSAMAGYVEQMHDRPARFRRQVEEAVIAAVLAAFPSDRSEDLRRPERGCAPHYLHRVEAAIDADPAADLTVQDMAALANVSGRTLYYGFRRFRDTTPLAWLRDRRLDLARQRLLAADPAADSVAAIAMDCGFAHLSRFAAQFRRRFGRAPAAVLRFKERGD
ncbi:MAG: AraC family transcriptional regulator [Sneathiellaceae bacterium]